MGLPVWRVADKWGYIDKAGSYVIKPQFDKAYAFEDGVAVVKLKDNVCTY